MKEIRIWGREGFFRKIRCNYYEMDGKSIKMYNVYENDYLITRSLIGYANLEKCKRNRNRGY